MRGHAVVVLLLLVVLAACGPSDQPGGNQPSFGGGPAPTVNADDLAAAKQRAGIEDCPKADGTAPAGDSLPDLTLDCLGGGRAVRLSGLAGKPAVINLWASYCKPCLEELPLLARADKAYGDDLQVLGVDFMDGAPDAAIELAQRTGVTYPLLVDRDGGTKGPLRVIGLPQTVFVDARGTVVATKRGSFRSYADLTAAIRRNLKVSP
ncbi:TlpA disulfide reductase family protein [Aeromicrobium sp.]|uniref:TlpA family protein disulfide reductase n=1 Tax=Aeromicrobium sp. TaxID=1871063 RepID=UPI0019C6CE6B|nr:TlpA disulfide reductase family protein [Aeromicrobium sp.]MBC7633695.1 TlpA family protein disulfide reductase [Aeromicrobium sp.]